MTIVLKPAKKARKSKAKVKDNPNGWNETIQKYFEKEKEKSALMKALNFLLKE